MRKSEFFEMNLFDEDEFYSEEQINENTEKIDEVLKNLEEPEHDATKQTEVEELESGESLKVALRKLAKAVSDYISHKADQVAHITAAERTAWNAKLGAEKIAANLTTDTDGMVLAAAMGKQLANSIAELSNVSARRFKMTGVAVDLSSMPNGVFIVTITNLIGSNTAGAIGIVQKANSSTVHMQILAKSEHSTDWSVAVKESAVTLSGTNHVNNGLVWSFVWLNNSVA